MPSAGAVSHRQQARKNAISTEVLALIRPPLDRSKRAGIPYQCFKVSASPPPVRTTASIWLAVCPWQTTSASTFQRIRRQVCGL